MTLGWLDPWSPWVHREQGLGNPRGAFLRDIGVGYDFDDVVDRLCEVFGDLLAQLGVVLDVFQVFLDLRDLWSKIRNCPPRLAPVPGQLQ